MLIIYITEVQLYHESKWMHRKLVIVSCHLPKLPTYITDLEKCVVIFSVSNVNVCVCDVYSSNLLCSCFRDCDEHVHLLCFIMLSVYSILMKVRVYGWRVAASFVLHSGLALHVSTKESGYNAKVFSYSM